MSLTSGTITLAQAQSSQTPAKGSEISSRALTESEIEFLNSGGGAIATSAVDQSYPEYSNDIFAALEGTLLTLADGETVRLLVTVQPDLPQSAAYGELASNAIARKDEVVQALAGSSALVVENYDSLPILLIEVDAQSLSMLASIDAIGGVELDRQVEPYHNSTMPVIGVRNLQLHSTTGAGFEGGSGGWDVAVLDTGLLNSHVAVAGRVASEACFVSDFSCPNGTNSMIGSGASGGCGAAGGRCWHGTHVSGTAMGEFTSNGLLDFDGVAPGADLHSIQVFNSAASSAFFSDIISGLQYVNNLVLGGARIASANMSLGGGAYSGNCDFASPSLETVASTLRTNGVMVIAAAGNGYSTSTMGIPACLSSVVAIGNTTDGDAVSSSSSTSPEMDLWAPGTNVTSAIDYGTTALETLTGTSMSAPHVAGAAAMLRECYVRPGSSANSPFIDDALLQLFSLSGVPVSDQRSGGFVTRPRIDVAAAAELLRPNDRFANATGIGFANGSYLGVNTCATAEALEPISGSRSASVWYAYQVPYTGIYSFDTCASATSFDTVLSVYSGDYLSTLVTRVSNDDGCGLKSAVTFPAIAGENLKVAVTGYGLPNEFGDTGVFELNWSFDTHTCNGLAATIVGTNGNDTIYGTAGNDVIVALGGNDGISSYGGNDTICAGDGNDTVFAGGGNDWVDGGSGGDAIKGQLGNDNIIGGFGNDIIRGSRGDDVIDGGAGNDNIDGGWGNDFVLGSDGDDTLLGSLGNDILRGGEGNDNMDGAEGADRLIGENGNDYLKGGPDNDELYGGNGADVLRGSRGDDYLTGQAGNDSLNGGVHTGGDRCVVEVSDSVAPVACEILL